MHNVELISDAVCLLLACYRTSCHNQSEMAIANTWHMEIPS